MVESPFQSIELFLRAVRGSESCGRPWMLRVWLDGLDDQVELIGAVDLSEYAVIAARQDVLGFGEVVELVNPVRGVISHDEHDARAVLRPGDESEMIGAEVEHGWGSGKGPKDGPSHAERR
jgi:hypothetical protein